jgi:hypothetical protein
MLVKQETGKSFSISSSLARDDVIGKLFFYEQTLSYSWTLILTLDPERAGGER